MILLLIFQRNFLISGVDEMIPMGFVTLSGVFKRILSCIGISLLNNLDMLTSKMATEKETIPITMSTENDDKVLDSDRIPATLVPASDETSECGLCHRGHISHPLAAGKLYRISGSLAHVHYFCMLFSAYAKQIGGKRKIFNHKCHSPDEIIFRSEKP